MLCFAVVPFAVAVFALLLLPCPVNMDCPPRGNGKVKT